MRDLQPKNIPAYLITRLEPPPLRPGLIMRGRLCQKLDRSASHPLALIVAPAGSGKTSLIAGWLTAQSQLAAWVSLDEVDNTPPRLWGYFTFF